MATAILKQIFDLEIYRTRDLEELEKFDIVYDVGRGEFDHHGVDKVYREDGIPYAASGLIWDRFGRQVIEEAEPNLSETEVESVFSYIDRNLIKGIDALDNNLRPQDSDIRIMSIVAIISNFNPTWDSEENEDEAFKKAVDVAEQVFQRTLKQRLAVLRSKDMVIKAFESREKSEILILETQCPYREALRKVDKKEEVFYVIYPKENGYALETVRGSGGKDKKPLPKEWAGKENEELAEITGVEDAIFCHTGRFVAVAESLDGILKMADLALGQKGTKFNKKLFRFSNRFNR